MRSGCSYSILIYARWENNWWKAFVRPRGKEIAGWPARGEELKIPLRAPRKNVSRRQMSCGRASTFSKKPESRRAHTVLLYIERASERVERMRERPIAAFQHLFCSKPTAGRARYLITGANFLLCSPLSGNEIILWAWAHSTHHSLLVF